MLINLSDLPSRTWDQTQTNMAIEEFESIFDIEFPTIKSNMTEKEIQEISDQYVKKCVKYFCNADRNNAVYICGEGIFTFCFVSSMLKKGFRCILSSVENTNNSENSLGNISGKFVKFREYRLEY